MLRVALALAAAAVAATLAGAAEAAPASPSPPGPILFAGKPVFPIVLSPGPPLGSETPWGTGALAETIAAGVNVFRVGPPSVWTDSDIASALAWDRAAADKGVYTWVNLSGYGQALPGSPEDASLAQVVGTLAADPSGRAIAMWRGRDEPFWSDMAPPTLQFAYCRVTSRGDPSWCEGEPALDPQPLWVTIEAPRGTVDDLAPYAPVTDIHGVDIYPVSLADQAAPDLHRVGTWTATLASISPTAPVWTTLQICSSGSNDKTTGAYVLPTLEQERYMAYDAILNGAGALAFYGGSLAGCWTPSDADHHWNWTFWQSVLKPIVQELSASAPIEPALLNIATSKQVATDDDTAEAVLRQGTSVDDVWLIAARSGLGSTDVTFSGLPQWAHRGGVYREHRGVVASGGSLTDTFDQWAVHVYHFVEPLLLRNPRPGAARVGARVVLRGRGLAAATKVTVAGADARFTIRSDNELVATVPRVAHTGPLAVTSPLAHVESRSPLAILPTPASPPRITGTPRVGRVLKATRGSWYGDRATRYSFEWLRCDRLARRCRPIPGATKQILWLASGRAGSRVRIVVTAHAASGSARSTSGATRPVGR